MANPAYIVEACNGQSMASAAAVAALFFLLMLVALGNLLVTGYPLYIVLTVSGLMRGVGFAFKAAYLTKCAAPAGEGGLWGVWLALTNAGFGIAIVAQCLILAAWLCCASDQLAPRNRGSLVLLARLLIPTQICFGPVLGVIASGLVYGSDNPRYWAVGDHLLRASVWGTFGVLVTYSLLCARVVTHALSAYGRVRGADTPTKDGADDAGAPPTRGSLLVAVLLASAMLLLFASCVRVSELYNPSLWHDHLWYTVCSLPELLALLLLLGQQGLVARIGTADRVPTRGPQSKGGDVEVGSSA